MAFLEDRHGNNRAGRWIAIAFVPNISYGLRYDNGLAPFPAAPFAPWAAGSGIINTAQIGFVTCGRCLPW